MICDECETVAHCMKNGCVPKQNSVDRLLDEAKLLADDRPVEVEGLPEWAIDAEHTIRRLVKALTSVPDWASEAIEQPSGVSTIAPVQQEPVAGKGKEFSERLKLCARNVAFVAAGRVDMSSAAMQEMFALIDHVCAGLDSPPAAPAQESDHEFKNFHRSLCERFGYVHDEKDWKRDLVSLEEWIAKKVQPQQEPVAYAVYHRMGGGKSLHWPEQHSPDGDESEYRLVPLYPPTLSLAQRQARSADTWVGLTDQEIENLWGQHEPRFDYYSFSCDIEAKLKEKNT